MTTDTLVAALFRRRFPVSVWPWRALAYLVTTVPMSAFLSIGLLVLGSPLFVVVSDLRNDHPVSVAAVVFFTVLALVTLALAPIVTVAVTEIERFRLLLVDRRPLPSRPWPGLVARYRSVAAWREVGYAMWLAGVVPFAYGILGILTIVATALVCGPVLVGRHERINVFGSAVETPAQAVPLALVGLLLIPVLGYLAGLVAAVQAVVARRLLGGPPETAALREVSRSRARLVDAYETERRRIERDVHDGAHPKLTSLTLHLGMARLDVPADSPAAKPLALAHEQAKTLMVTLRHIVHGIRPPSLSDLGLAGAVRELAAESPIPVTVEPAIGRELPELVETTGYFVVAEALTNVARHSGATAATVKLSRTGRDLVIEVSDNGHGGADPDRGSGLTGLADRVAAVDGRLLLASPSGGPTLIRVEIPCR